MYGYAALARYPLYEGTGYDMNGNEISEPLWQALLNFGIWTALFAGLCVYLVRKGTARV